MVPVDAKFPLSGLTRLKETAGEEENITTVLGRLSEPPSDISPAVVYSCAGPAR